MREGEREKARQSASVRSDERRGACEAGAWESIIASRGPSPYPTPAPPLTSARIPQLLFPPSLLPFFSDDHLTDPATHEWTSDAEGRASCRVRSQRVLLSRPSRGRRGHLVSEKRVALQEQRRPRDGSRSSPLLLSFFAQASLLRFSLRKPTTLNDLHRQSPLAPDASRDGRLSSFPVCSCGAAGLLLSRRREASATIKSSSAPVTCLRGSESEG